MKCVLIAVAIFMASFVVASPIAVPEPDAVAEPFQFYGASQTATPARKLKLRRSDIIPEELLTRSELVRRTQSPTSGPNVNKCSPANAVGGVSYTCGVGNDGPCCSINVSFFVSTNLIHISGSNKYTGLVRFKLLLLWRGMPTVVWFLHPSYHTAHVRR